MKTKTVRLIISGIPAALIIFCFLLFSSYDKKSAAPAVKCCTGYNISAAELKRFMLDSLHSIKFEGGVYSKADLLNIITSLNATDDSVYILNTLVNLDVSQGTDLAITSRHSNVKFLRSKHCHGCPNKPCCRNKLGVANINRDCISYDTLSFTQDNVKNKTSLFTPALKNK